MKTKLVALVALPLAVGTAAGFSAGCRAIVGIEAVEDVDGGPNGGGGQMSMDASMSEADAATPADASSTDSAVDSGSPPSAEAGAIVCNGSGRNRQACAQCCATSFGMSAPGTASPYADLVVLARGDTCLCTNISDAEDSACTVTMCGMCTEQQDRDVTQTCGLCAAEIIAGNGCRQLQGQCRTQLCQGPLDCLLGCNALPH